MPTKLNAVLDILRRTGSLAIVLDGQGFDYTADSLISWASYYDETYEEIADNYKRYRSLTYQNLTFIQVWFLGIDAIVSATIRATYRTTSTPDCIS